MKKIITVALSVVMVLSLTGLSVFAARPGNGAGRNAGGRGVCTNSGAVCSRYEECPNGGVPARDGSGAGRGAGRGVCSR